MWFVVIIVLALVSAGQVAAADIFTNNTMFMRVQCEIGEFAKEAAGLGLDPRMKADVDFSWTVEVSTKVEGRFGAGWLFGYVTVRQARGWQDKDKLRIVRTFNVHERNTKACQKDRLKVQLGILECLRGSVDPLKDGTKASCEKTKIIGVKTDAEGDVKLLKIIEAGAKGEYDVTSTYLIIVSAPAKEQNKQEAKLN